MLLYSSGPFNSRTIELTKSFLNLSVSSVSLTSLTVYSSFGPKISRTEVANFYQLLDVLGTSRSFD